MKLSKFKTFLKNLPLAGPLLKYVSGTFIQRKNDKRNATFFSYKNNFRNSEDCGLTKINKKYSLYKDRLYEVKSFFNKSISQMAIHYLVNGTPNTNYYRSKLHHIFEETGLDKEDLKSAYEKAAFMYVNRLMLRYHNYRLGKNILKTLEKLSLEKKQVSILDYGCGVADPSLYLALHGVNITIVDLDDIKLDFAISRFKKRNLNINYYRATQTETPVDIGPQKFDVIIMAEFLEHVRNPRSFLEFAIEHLNNEHGVLFDSLGPTHNHNISGDHLVEAKESMESSDY